MLQPAIRSGSLYSVVNKIFVTLKLFPEHTINVCGKLMDLSEPRVMGILNVTPDSFYAGSRKQTEYEIAARADSIMAEGGSIIDVGAFSTRPGAAHVESGEEMERLRMALQTVRRVQPDAPLSVDTFRPEVARMAVEEFGVGIINDVSEGNVNGAFGGAGATAGTADEQADEGRCPEMFSEVARLGVAYILMSVKPDIMSMMKAFAKEVVLLRGLGVKDIILDPGFGFGKSMEQNYELLAKLGRLGVFDLPLLVGVSRKSMITRLLGISTDDALNGTTVVNTVAMLRSGASIIRVHDVKPCVEAVKIVKEIENYV